MPISGGGDINFGIRITADNQVFVDGVRASREEVSKLGDGLKELGRDAQEAERGQEGLTGAVAKGSIAADLALKAWDALVSTYGEMKEQTRQAQQEHLRLESVLNATGMAAGRTAAQVTEVATAMAKVTRFDDDGIKRAAAQLATFGDIVGDRFDRTLRLAGDMSAVFGGDLTSAAMKLGKALSDPDGSLASLERQFGRFDPEVKRAIKSALELNDVLAYQDILIEQVEKRVGGAAQNAYRGLELQIEGTKKAYNKLLEAMGNEIFDAKSKEASIWEKALTQAADNFTSRVQTIKGLFEGGGVWLARMASYMALLRGDLGAATAISAGADRVSDAGPGGGSPRAPSGADPDRQRAAAEFQRLLDNSETKAEKFAKEWRHAWASIIQDGKVGTAEAAKILGTITEKFAEAPRAVRARQAEQQVKIAEGHVDAYNRHLNDQDKLYASIEERLKGVVAQADLYAQTLGMSRLEAEYFRKEVELRADAEKRIQQLDPERRAAARELLELAVARLRAEKNQRIEMEAELEWAAKLLDIEQARTAEAARTAENLGNSITDALMRAFESGKGFAKALKDVLLNTFNTLVLRPIIQPIAQAGANALLSGFGSIGSAIFGGGGGGAAGGGGGSFAGLAGLGGNLASSLGGGLMEAGNFLGWSGLTEFGGGMSGALLSGGGAAGSLGASFAAAIPYLAPLVAIAAIVSALQKPGGPKEGGSFFGNFSSSGAFLGNGLVPGSDNGRFFTPAGADSQVGGIGRNAAASYFGALNRFGGAAGGDVSFGIGYDTDPRGTSPNRISSAVMIGGQRVFGSQDRDVGRDSNQLAAELELESRRAVLAALQASDLPDAIAAIFSTVNAASASTEEIDKLFQIAEGVQSVLDAAAEFDPSAIIAQASRSSTESFRAQGRALADLASRTTLTTESLSRLSSATAAYRQSATELLLGLEQAKLSIGDMFGQTSRSIRLAGLDGQGQYDFYQSESERLFGQVGSATSAAEVERLAGQINADINAAFALLTPEQQRAMNQEYLTRIDNVNKVIQERLTKLQEDAAAETKKQLDDIKAAIEKLATDQQAAADTQNVAADKQLAAASNRTITLRFDTSGGGGQFVVSDGG